MVRVRVGLLAILASCGRWGFDHHAADGTPGDTPVHDDAPVFHLDAGECPPNYLALGLDAGTGAKSCYRFVATGATWISAEFACEADASGAHLVVIDDMNEAAVVDTLDTTLDTYVGVSDRVGPGVYLTVTGMPLSYVTWAPSEPTGGTNCVEFADARTFDDLSCDTINEYICEYDGIPANPKAY